MNKKITICELIVRVNNNEAPEQIKWHDMVFSFDNECGDYNHHSIINNSSTAYLFSYLFSEPSCPLKYKVEILDEEKDEFEDIEEYEDKNEPDYYYTNESRYNELVDTILCNDSRLNQLIRNQKYLKNEIERLNKDE